MGSILSINTKNVSNNLHYLDMCEIIKLMGNCVFSFDVTIHAWAQVLQVEKELEKVAQSLDRLFDLNEQTFWEIEELILQDLPQNKYDL